MAGQLPPKSETMMTHQNWNAFQPEGTTNWAVDHEFADFTWARRNTHRRSSSDSVAFLPMLVDEYSSPTAAAGFEDEQFMSLMLAADDHDVTVGMRLTSDVDPSTPSDNNSNDDDHQTYLHNKPKEEMSGSNPITTLSVPPTSADTIFDPKRVKRILANRQSARRSRVRKLQYISELERSVTNLQTEVSAMSPRVAFLDHQRLILNVDNSAMKQRIAALIQDKLFKDAHQEALKNEIERLRQVYRHQTLKVTPHEDGNNNDDLKDES